MTPRICIVFAAALPAWLPAAGPAPAQDVRTVEVRFAPGSTGASYSDTITGYQSVDYLLTASAGQVMHVAMSTSNPSSYFNVFAPGADTAIFIGSTEGTVYQGVLPRSGQYRIQVFLMRNAARRDETAAYRLDLSITGSTAAQPLPAPAPDFADGDAGGPDWWEIRTRAGGHLNIRSGPGRYYGVATSLPSGSVVRNMGCQPTPDGRWCQIDYGANRGWALGDYLREAAPPPGLRPVIPAAVPPVAEGGAGGPDWYLVRNAPAGDRLNLRSGPSTDYDIVGQAVNGAILRSLGCRDMGGARWCQVQNRAGNLRGWVNARFLGESGPP